MELQKLWESLPLIWLMVLCIFDLVNDFTLRKFFCQEVDEIRTKMRIILGEKKDWECPSLKDTLAKNYLCPIYYTLIKYSERPFGECPKVFGEVKVKTSKSEWIKAPDEFWITIRKGFLRHNQAMYFEVIFIQFFIVSLTTNLEEIRFISACIAIAIFLFPYFLLTYNEQKPLKFYEDKKQRLLFTIFTWFFVLGLSSMTSFPF